MAPSTCNPTPVMVVSTSLRILFQSTLLLLFLQSLRRENLTRARFRHGHDISRGFLQESNGAGFSRRINEASIAGRGAHPTTRRSFAMARVFRRLQLRA